MPSAFNTIYVVYNEDTKEFLMLESRTSDRRVTKNRHQARFFRREADAKNLCCYLNTIADLDRNFKVRRISFRVL